jgi:hypothetical protein
MTSASMGKFLAGLGLIEAFLAFALLAGCNNQSSSRIGQPHQLKRSELSDSERKYGIAPIPDKSVTYQPDVIVVGGGAAAIRAESSNGFEWTIDAKAPHAADLAVGKVLFMTNRAVGRVLDVHSSGGDLIVVVGPVDITELVKEAHIHITDMPIDFSEALPYRSPDFPGQAIASLRHIQQNAFPVVFMKVADEATAPSHDVSMLVNFKKEPVVGPAGVGMRISSDGGGLKVSAEALVHLSKPTLSVVLEIENSKVVGASVKLTGAAGLTWNFEVGTDLGLSANVNGIIEPDTDFSIPIGGIGPVPLAATVRQRFSVKTALGVRNSTLSATGDYSFDGGFSVGYVNKNWKIAGPVGFKSNTTLMKSADGISIAASGLDMAHMMKIIVGVGVHGFAAGPYFSFTSGIGLFKGSDLGMIQCKEATLVIGLNGGVGYLIPRSITSFINSILKSLKIDYQINGEGGIAPEKGINIINETTTLPGCKARQA